MIGIRALSGIIRREASKALPLAFRSPVYVIPTVKANSCAEFSGKRFFFYRLFSSSPKLSSQGLFPLVSKRRRDLFSPGIGFQVDDDVEGEKVVRYAIKECPEKQTLVLTKEEDTLITEIHMPCVNITSELHVKGIPLLIKGHDIDRGVHLEMRCTCYRDKICAEIDNRYPIVNLLKAMNLQVEGINPTTIYYLHQLKLELKEFTKIFAEKSDKSFYWSFFYSMLDYSMRRGFDFKTVDLDLCAYDDGAGVDDFDYYDAPLPDGMEDTTIGRPAFTVEERMQIIHVMTRKDGEETICIEELSQSAERDLTFIFSLSNDKGMCLQFHCAASPGKISFDILDVIDNWKSKDLIIAGPEIGLNLSDPRIPPVYREFLERDHLP